VLAFACSLNPHPDLPGTTQGSAGGTTSTGGSTSNVGGISAAGSIDVGLGGTGVTVPAQGGEQAGPEPSEDAAGASAGGAAGAEGGGGENSAGAAGAP
jgi:hypothetical protein